MDQFKGFSIEGKYHIRCKLGFLKGDMQFSWQDSKVELRHILVAVE